MKIYSLGSFVVFKRKQKNITARQLANKLGISNTYLCEIEKNKKHFFSNSITNKMIIVLCDDYEEECLLYDLIAIGRKDIAIDIQQYLIDTEVARKAVRIAKKYKISDEIWEKFISDITLKSFK